MSNGKKDSAEIKDLPKYTLKISKQKGIHMRVTPRGELVVHANPFCTKESIDHFVSLHMGHILIKKKDMTAQIFGRSFRIREVCGMTNHVSTSEDELIIQYRKDKKAKEVYDSFIKFYAKEVFEDITNMLMIRFKEFGLQRPQIKLRRMKKSWGVCHPDKGLITLNLELVHYPVEFVEYVICHELIHLIEPDHSQNFYQVLSKVMPDYKRRLDLIETSNEKQYLM